MDIELIDKAWACLPKEFKEEVKEIFRKCLGVPKYEAITIKPMLLGYLFGHHNLTSDEEGEEEILTVKRSKVIDIFTQNTILLSEGHSEYLNGYYTEYLSGYYKCHVLKDLFGSKCLPDKESKPAEPKEDKHFDNILKDDFHDHNRLHIAAMAMQGILSNADRMKKYEYVATEPPCEELTVVVARNALRYADELLRQSGKGNSK